MIPRLPRTIGGLTVLAGAALTLGFAPFYLWPVGVVALAFLFHLLCRASSGKQAAMAAFVFGMGHFTSSLYWIPRSFYLDAGERIVPMLIGGIPALLGMCVMLSAYLAVVGWVTYRAGGVQRTMDPSFRWDDTNGRRFIQPLVFIGAWVGVEIWRNVPPFYFPWNPLGTMWAGSLPLMQSASVVGVWGMSALVLLLAVLVAQRTRVALTVAAVLVIVLFGFGHYRLAQAPTLSAQPAQTWVRLVQADIGTITKWEGSKRYENVEKYLTLSATSNPSVTAIIWPETAVAFTVADDAGIRAKLASVLQPWQTLTLGFMRFEQPDPALPYSMFNSMGTLEANGQLLGTYDKHLLVPFGEVLPLKALTERFLRVISVHRGSFVHGTTPAILPMGEITAMPLICYEAGFPAFVASQWQGQTALLNISNDNWFEHTIGPAQHFALGRLRAVELGLPFIRVANTGWSGVIDPYGRIINQAGPAPNGIDVPVPSPLPQPPLMHAIWAFLYDKLN
ncbi:MAG: apolipoprotein N-acyltransferase [Alphaproteobacteria bacterium]